MRKHGLTIRTKLIMGFGFILLLMAVMTTVYLRTVQRLHRDAQYVESLYGQAWLARQVEGQVNCMLKEVSNLAALEAQELPEEPDMGATAVAHSFTAWEQQISRERHGAASDPRGRMADESAAVAAQVRRSYEAMAEHCRQVLDLARQGRRDEALQMLHGVIETEFNAQFARDLVRIAVRKRTQAATIQVAAEYRRESATTLFLCSAIVALGIGLLCSIRITRSIIVPIHTLHGATIRVSQGDLDTQIAIHSDDEIGQLASSFDRMTRSLKQSCNDLQLQITQRLAAEKQKEQTVVQLEKLNGELQDFAYIISHDLKAPLAGIKVLIEWLCRDYADKLDASGVEQLHVLHHRVDRMRDLIEGIIRYSRVVHDRQESVEVDLDALLPAIVDAIAPPSNIQVSIQKPMPVIVGQVAQVTQVFQSLIANAVRYMDKPAGRVVVACEDEDALWKFSVSDNGRGIEEKHFQAIFHFFQTLAPKDSYATGTSYESTGVGLPLAKRIVELCGGSISVESQVGQGSTFSFTWPKDKRAVDRQPLVDDNPCCRLTTVLTEDN